jgi:hypothetical protein
MSDCDSSFLKSARPARTNPEIFGYFDIIKQIRRKEREKEREQVSYFFFFFEFRK